MELYYDTKTKTATHIKSDTTIISTDKRVVSFFKPLSDGKELSFDENNLPLIVDKVIKIDEIIASKIMEINQACTKAITSGFKSSSLGVEHIYQSDRDDQINLMGLVTDGVNDSLKCGLLSITLENGAEKETIFWEYKPHTIEQLKQVFTDGKNYKTEQLIKFNNLKNQVQNATTVDELDGINW